VHAGWQALLDAERPDPRRTFALTTHGTRHPTDVAFREGDWLVFGAESTGLPHALRESFAPECRLRLPMRPGNRSLNLSNAVAVVVFEAWRQMGFAGGA
jgi:tRNA (cytidine/uridine-2'-O-)-methyltransferase